MKVFRDDEKRWKNSKRNSVKNFKVMFKWHIKLVRENLSKLSNILKYYIEYESNVYMTFEKHSSDSG